MDKSFTVVTERKEIKHFPSDFAFPATFAVSFRDSQGHLSGQANLKQHLKQTTATSLFLHRKDDLHFHARTIYH